VIWEGVDLDKSNTKRDFPLIEKSKRANSTIGPEPLEEVYNNKKKKRLPIIALELGPALNRAVVYSSVFKGLERSQVSAHILSGVGMGALAATFYARGDTPELVEWKFHNLLKELKEKPIYSDDWKEALHNFIEQEFKKRKIQSLKKALIIPVFDTSTKEINYITKGSIYNALVANFHLDRSKKIIGTYISAMELRPLSLDKLKNFGADIVLSFDSLTNKVKFLEYNDEHIFGLYNKSMSRIIVDSKEAKGFYQLPVGTMPLDGRDRIQDYILKSVEYMDENSKSIKTLIKDWDSSKKSLDVEGIN
jgi:hypothetical protein